MADAAAGPPPAATVAEAAPAKLNLSLRVVGRRDDGLHLLDGLVAFTELGDRLAVRAGPPGAGPSLAVDGPFADALAGETDNLVLRAARSLGAACDHPADVAFRLTKMLPVASGIGGGSADAAAALRSLVRLWGLPTDDPRSVAVAARLGADVPMCLAGRTAWMAGIGDVLAPGPDLAGLPVVLANPGIALSTPAVFKAHRARIGEAFSRADRPALPDRPDPATLAAALAGTANDLTAAAVALAPEIGTLVAAVEAQPGCRLARMSGSGATVVGLFDTPVEAGAAADALRAARAAAWVQASALR